MKNEYNKFMCSECFEIRVEKNTSQTICKKCMNHKEHIVRHFDHSITEEHIFMFLMLLMLPVWPIALPMLIVARYIDKIDN